MLSFGGSTLTFTFVLYAVLTSHFSLGLARHIALAIILRLCFPISVSFDSFSIYGACS